MESPTVKYEMLDDNMAYIQIVEFDDVTIDQFTDALATVKGSDMKGLILDLRGNPGGTGMQWCRSQESCFRRE